MLTIVTFIQSLSIIQVKHCCHLRR